VAWLGDACDEVRALTRTETPADGHVLGGPVWPFGLRGAVDTIGVLFMPSFVSWVDFSRADRDRMRKAIALYAEKETRDELGLGTVRDAFADALFPGTSTIQTRLRYVLLIPWIYTDLERARKSSKSIGRRARDAEVALISVLADSEDSDGTIGRRSRSDLQRLPSSIYWAALQRWQICLFAGSREQFHRAFGQLMGRRRSGLVPDDEGIESATEHVWHPRFPAPPPGWPDEVSLTLTREEAEFVRGRWAQTCAGSLLDHFAQRDFDGDADWPWATRLQGALPTGLAEQLDLARRFSLVMHGASLLYNLLLAERYKDPEKGSAWAEKYRGALAEWAAAEEDEPADLRSFDVGELWRFTARVEARVPLRTQGFVEAWTGMLRETDPAAIAGHEPARTLVMHREKALKKTRSRFVNQRALDSWKGSSGEARLNYRWGVVSSHLRDLQGAE